VQVQREPETQRRAIAPYAPIHFLARTGWSNRKTLYADTLQFVNVIAEQDENSSSTEIPPMTTAITTIAVIDDDCRVRESLDDLLDCAGYRVRLFASSREFLQSSALHEVDCLISDIAMPAMDGFALQRLVRRMRPTLPVILVTGHPVLAAATIEAERGGRPLFEKPFDRDRLLAAINLELREAGGI